MITSKRKLPSFLTPALSVDSWEMKHEDNGDISENFTGKQAMQEEDSLLYLGHVISKNGGNMSNIIGRRNNSIGTEKQILKIIKGLGPYTFEGAFIYIQSLIRTSLLYGSETMYNITEKELRAIESIEESAIQKSLKTKRSCPKHILYLESGIYPARYIIHRKMLSFLKYILNQPNDSILYRMFKVQKENPTKGDWVSSVEELLINYEINFSFVEIKSMKSSLYKSLVKRQVEKTAFKNLLNKKENGQKGSNIEYTSMKLADYLHPECEISLADKYKIFSIRSEMIDFPSNYGNKTLCTIGCLEILNSEYVTICPRINKKRKNYF